MDDACLGGELTGGKRGRGSENKTPFLATVQVNEDGKPVVMKLAPVEAFRKDEVEEWAGCEHVPQVTGGGPGSCEAPGPGWVSTALGNVKLALDGTYHRLAPKHAARYLGEFQYRFNRRYDLAALPQRLLRAATLPLPRQVLEPHPYGR